MANKTVGIVSLYNDPNLLSLTSSRNIASLALLGRYTFIDFALSNLLSSGVENIIILVKRGARSLVKHLEFYEYNYKINTKRGSLSFYIFEGNTQNTELNNLRGNIHYLKDLKADNFLFISPEVLMNYNYSSFITSHNTSNKEVSILTAVSYDPRIYNFKVVDDKLQLVHGKETSYDFFTYSFIINANLLYDILNDESKIYLLNELNYFDLNIVKYLGFYQHYYSLEKYMSNSLSLLNEVGYKGLFSNQLIYTRSYDTPPARYGAASIVKGSVVANGSIIEGTIISSIIGRDVKVGKGSVIKNSIIFTHTIIGDNCLIENAIIDKNCTISDNIIIRGSEITVIKEGEKL